MKRPILKLLVIITFFSLGVVTDLIAGARGFFPFDQSIVFDGGYRIFSGQFPYRDFYSPHGLVAFVLQALSFYVWGVSFHAALYGGACLSGLAVLASYAWVRQLLPGAALLATVAAVLTSVWFYAPFGTIYLEQTGFLFGLLSWLLCTWAALRVGPRGSRERLAIFVSGVMVALAFFTKQNVALLVAPLSVIILCWWARGNLKVWFFGVSLFFFGFLAVFFLVICIFTEHGVLLPALEYLIKRPVDIAMRRFNNRLGGGVNVFSYEIIAGIALVLGLLVLACMRGWSHQMLHWRDMSIPGFRRSLVATVLVYLVLFSWIFLQTAYNNPSFAYAYVGIVVVLFFGLYHEMLQRSGGTTGILACVVASLSVAVLLYVGGVLSFNRKAQEAVDGASFGDSLGIPGLEGLRWGDPTLVNVKKKISVSQAEMVRLIVRLRQQRQPFFIFPDFTFLYGILGEPSRQPLIWFHRGVSYPIEYDSQLDAEIVTRLREQRIGLVVLEEDSFFGTVERQADFPKLMAFIEQEFVEWEKIGVFKIFRPRLSSRFSD